MLLYDLMKVFPVETFLHITDWGDIDWFVSKENYFKEDERFRHRLDEAKVILAYPCCDVDYDEKRIGKEYLDCADKDGKILYQKIVID